MTKANRTIRAGQATRSAVVAACALASAVLGGCTAAARSSSGALPLSACGTVVYSGAAGAAVIDATGPTARVDSLTTGAGIFLRLSNSCTQGATLMVPPVDASVAGVAHTSDGGIALIGLIPKRCEFRLVAGRSGSGATTITVDIADFTPGG